MVDIKYSGCMTCLKVGGNSAGKVSTIQCLAQLTGHKLVEFPMNSETDTTELLGGFEQVITLNIVLSIS